MSISHKIGRSLPQQVIIKSNPHLPSDTSCDESRFPGDLDHFKFRIVRRRGKHYFKDVRFRPPKASNGDREIVEFFEGKCIENISLKELTETLGNSPILPRIHALVTELRKVLSD